MDNNFLEDVKEYKDSIYKQIRGFLKRSGIEAHIAEDVYQDVLVELWVKLPTWDASLLPKEHYIRNITNNVCKRERERVYKRTEMYTDPEDIISKPSTHEMDQDMLGLINQVDLSPRDAQIVYLNIQGYSQAWIANRIGVSPPTVSRVIATFRDNYLEILENR